MASSLRAAIAKQTSVLAGLQSRRTFGVSSRFLAGKEDALHKEDRDAEIEEHKHDSLNKAKDGKGHWKDELASNSESIVKAERGEVEASESTIKKLQEESVKASKK